MSIKEENLIQYSGTIKAGQRLVKVGNTFMPVGVGGAFEPGNADTSAFEAEMTTIIGEDANITPVLVSGMKFYKCASVDTANKTWSGYELILQDGVYVVSETMTEGLTYVGFMPFADKIYSEDGMLELKDFYQGFQLVSPTNMTSEENDEWRISASGYLGSATCPYRAFSGNDTEIEGWYSAGYSSLPQWIQWHNKKRKTKVKSYSMRVGTHNPEEIKRRFPGTWELQGSDDGSSWVTVDRHENHGVVENGQTYTFTCQNPGSYYYYRIYVTESAVPGEAFAAIAQIKAYGQF
jgi:hypothetical protein